LKNSKQTTGLWTSATGQRALLLFLLLLYPLLGMLWHHGYPFISSEIFLTLAGFALFAAGVSVLLSPCRWLVVNLVIITLITLVLLIHSNLLFLGILVVLVSCLVLSIWLKDQFPKMSLVVIVALIIGAYFDNQIDHARNATQLEPLSQTATQGPLIHIVVDGFIGPDGLPRSPESQNLRGEILEFFEAFDFQLHTRAYTHYNNTTDSLYRAFNFQNDDENIFQKIVMLREPISIRKNAWFEALGQQGFPIMVYQTESVNFCESTAVDYCNVFPIPNLKTIHHAVDDIGTRVAVLLRALLGQSVLISEMLLEYMRIGSWGISTYDQRLLSTMATDIPLRPDGAYFAHMLIPHSPLVYRQDCSVDYNSEPWERFTATTGLIGNSIETRAMRYKKFVPHAQCALKELGSLFQALKDQGLYQQATILVHGDHGTSAYNYSPVVSNMDKLRYRDLREMYSALFAVKLPGGTAGLNHQTTSLNVLMAQTLADISGLSKQQVAIEVSNETEPFIYLSGATPLEKMLVDIFTRREGDPESEL